MIEISEETKELWLNIDEIPFIARINDKLVRQQELLQRDVGQIFKLHGEKLYLFNDARLFLHEIIDNGGLDEKMQATIDEFNKNLEKLEFEAQVAWGFDENPDFHTWWLDMPGCTCPKMDNADRYGTGRILSGTCPWHGNFDNTRKMI